MWFNRKKEPSREQSFQEAIGAWEAAANTGRTDDQERVIARVLELAGEFGAEDDSPESALTNEALLCQERADWVGVETAYRMKLALPSIAPHTECKAYFELSSLYFALGREEDSLRHARFATVAARKENCSGLLVMALGREAGTYQALARFAEAAPLITEALSLIEDEKMYGNMRAGLLVQRAHGAVAEGRLMEAIADLDAALILLEPLARLPFAGGAQERLACWWEVTAKLRSQLNDQEGSTTAWQEAVAASRKLASLPHCAGVYTQRELAMMLRGLAASLRRVGDYERAAQAICESQAIMEAVGLE